MTAPLAIYIHWPFCTRICPYCDFNVYRDRGADFAKWRESLLRDIRWFSKKVPNRHITSIYFGGGTPSLMSVDLVREVIYGVSQIWPLLPDTEITLEANPTDREAAKFEEFRAAGVTRLSLGTQSLNTDALQFLGRNHSAQDAIDAIEMAFATWERVNTDLIYARPGQTLEDWHDELLKMISLGVSHLSLYQLTVEPDTAFQKAVDRGCWTLPPDQLQADFFDLTQEICASNNLPAYEISNHANPGHESRHNLTYWQGGDYLGIGPGAHGRLTIGNNRYATESVLDPKQYLAMEPANKIRLQKLSPADQATEYALMGLRIKDGISLSRMAKLAPAMLDHQKLASLESDGLLKINADTLRLTSAGQKVLNRVVLELMS